MYISLRVLRVVKSNIKCDRFSKYYIGTKISRNINVWNSSCKGNMKRHKNAINNEILTFNLKDAPANLMEVYKYFLETSTIKE